MKKILPQKFYNQPTLLVAKELLGKYLVRKTGNKKVSGLIAETEAYIGPHDLASHASRGRTPRTEVMFGPPGYWYVYLIYGMYYCLNVVTEKKDYPAAVLIRAVIPEEGLEIMAQNRKIKKAENLTNGPGKLCSAFGIDKNFNNTRAFGKRATLYIEDRGKTIKPRQIIALPRVGIDYAGKYKDKPWRFVLNKFE